MIPLGLPGRSNRNDLFSSVIVDIRQPDKVSSTIGLPLVNLVNFSHVMPDFISMRIEQNQVYLAMIYSTDSDGWLSIELVNYVDADPEGKFLFP
jgi:hypothetical protein